MRKKNPRVVARNMRWMSLALGACLILVLVFCFKQFLSTRTLTEGYNSKLSNLTSGLRETIVLRLDYQSNVYETCADYLNGDNPKGVLDYLAGASAVTGASDLTNAAWNRVFPENKELSGLCDQLKTVTNSLNSEILNNMTPDQRYSLADLFDHLSTTLDRDSSVVTLTALIGVAEPDTEAIRTEIDAIYDLLDRIDILLDSVTVPTNAPNNPNAE